MLDLSCRRKDGRYFVVTDRWQTFTELEIGRESLAELAQSCAEFLVHAADVEGLRQGMDMELIEKLGQWSPRPTTYAGGAKSLQDRACVTRMRWNLIIVILRGKNKRGMDRGRHGRGGAPDRFPYRLIEQKFVGGIFDGKIHF